ncbi:MFS transporter [Jeotgalibacillus campisalis]|uniref:Tetracycline resistance protein TETA(L)/TETK n=1 Tax=Jeotgalibacillus campisalis TaxID=220754 RepID=A0A0C2W8A3_9BACL|nr:MFS transporter [Jeotgalibacillus campisalis]KIL52821.1 tetracycline resistance protein TETA(L)/TETK [Jeotgalibacillus campisalis]
MNHSKLESPDYQRTIFVLSIAVWLTVMNTTMFNVALPDVLAEFSLAPSQGAWIVSGYSIVLAIFTIAYTRLSDYIPIRILLTIGIMIFGCSSIFGFFADTFGWLLAARVGQAAGAAAIPGLSMVFAGRFVPIHRRGRAMAMIASASSLGFGLGPVVGGTITDILDWNFLFIVTVFVMAVIPFLFILLPKQETRKASFDLLGGLLTGGAVTSFLLFVSTFQFLFLGSFVILALLLAWRITHTDIPFIQPELLSNRSYRLIVYLSYIGFTLHFALLVLMPLMIGQVFNLSATMVGLIIFPGAMLSAVAAIYVGRLIDEYGNIRVMLLSQILLLISALIFTFLSPYSVYMIMIGYMFTSFGFSSLSSSTTNEISRILPKDQVATGIGMKQLSQFVGSASGAVLGTTILEWRNATYSVASFQWAYASLIILMTLSTVLFFIYRKRAQSLIS